MKRAVILQRKGDNDMEDFEERLVYVRRHTDDEKLGTVKYRSLRAVSWRRISGGINKRDGQFMLYAKVWCNEFLDGTTVSHSCRHGAPPHDIRVVIQKCDNEKDVYEQLAKEAGERPKEEWRGKDVADRIRQIVQENPGITTVEIEDKLKGDIPKQAVQNSVRYLKTHVFKDKASLRSERYKNTQKLYLKE